ncbi:hypothetical protein LUZ63_016398 [Rhynchospora breviuscula]|uniref:F-box domain-containing protein n=1 Tax=Rhynchospora breviuscula TaxID=2022672 RepID=A0A9Q0C172_9POAL|nr:hypothetical protein LUZ63_016398 [Rhynchospora breviuscula]
MAGVDRISALPEETKMFILSLLPITDAVRTSVLSPSWRHLWTLLPGFAADVIFVGAPDRHNTILRWTEIVGRNLSSLRGPIHHFSLRYYYRPSLPCRLQDFLDVISQKDALQTISLYCVGHRLQVQLPFFRLLRDLDLSWLDIILPSDFTGFEQLTSLKLRRVGISQQDIQLLIDGSKKLTSIDCLLCSDRINDDTEQPLSVTFNCPLLKYLCFNFCKNSAEARIISAPSLEKACVTASSLVIAPPLEKLVWVGVATLRFLAGAAQVSHLSLDLDVLKSLSRVDVPPTPQIHFHQLRCLELIGVMFYMDRRMYKVFCSLLRSMPFLERLELECDEPMGYEERLNELDPITPNEYKKKEAGYLCLDQTLRRVAISIESLGDIENLMWMIHFILLNANVLELMKIKYSNDNSKVKSSLLEKFCEVEKASSVSQVVFVDITNEI